MNTLTEEEIADLKSRWPKCVTRPQDAHCSFLMEQREINFQPRYEDENPRKNEIENWKPPIVKDSYYEAMLMKEITSWKTETVFVQTEDRLKWVCQLLRTSKEIAVDIKWDEENSFLYSMSLLTIAIPSYTFVFDPYPLHLQIIEYLKPIFEDTSVIKLFHDHQSHILKLQACFHIYPAGVIDSQAVHSYIYKSRVSFTYAVFYYLGESFATTINKNYKWADCRARLEPPTEEKFLPPKLEKCCCINAQLLLRVWCFQKLGIESYSKLNKIDPEVVLRTIYHSSKESLTAKFTNEDFRNYVSSNYEVKSSDFIHYGLESFHQQQCYIEMLNWRMEQAKVCDTSPSQIITNLDMALIVKNDPKTTQEFLNKSAKGEDVMTLIAKQVNSILPISSDGQKNFETAEKKFPKKEIKPLKFTLSATKCLLPNPAQTNVESLLKPVGKSLLLEPSIRKVPSPEKNYLKVPGFKVLPILPSIPIKIEPPILSESANNLNSIPLMPKAIENVQHIPPAIPLSIYYNPLISPPVRVSNASSTINNILPLQANSALQFINKQLSTFVDKAIAQARSIESKWYVERMTRQTDCPSEKDRTSRDREDLTSRKSEVLMSKKHEDLTPRMVEDIKPRVLEDIKPIVLEDIKPIVLEDIKPRVLEDSTPRVREDPKLKVREDPTPKVREDPTLKVREDPTPKVREDPTPKVREDPTPKVSEDPTPKVREDPNPKVHEDPTPKVSEDPTPKVREDPNPKVREDPTPKVREDLTSRVREDLTSRLREDLTSRLLKDVKTPRVLKDVKTPRVLKDVKTPSVLKDVKIPSVLKDVKNPSVLKDVKTPSVLKDVKTPRVRKDVTPKVQKKKYRIGGWRWHLRCKQRVCDEDRTPGVRDKDWTYFSRVNDEDRRSRVRDEDRMYSSRVHEKDRTYSSRVHEEDRMYSSRVHEEDRMYSSRVHEEDRSYSSRVHEEDRMYSSRVHEEDRMYSSRVDEEDRMYSSRMDEEDRMYSSRVDEEDRMYSSRVHEEITLISRDPKPERRNIINVVGEGRSDRNAGGDLIFGENNRTENNDVICDYCNKVGHVRKYCRKRIKGLPPYYEQSNSHYSSGSNDLSSRERFRPHPYARPPVHFSPPPDLAQPRYSCEFMSNVKTPALMNIDFQEDHIFPQGESWTPNRRWH